MGTRGLWMQHSPWLLTFCNLWAPLATCHHVRVNHMGPRSCFLDFSPSSTESLPCDMWWFAYPLWTLVFSPVKWKMVSLLCTVTGTVKCVFRIQYWGKAFHSFPFYCLGQGWVLINGGKRARNSMRLLEWCENNCVLFLLLSFNAVVRRSMHMDPRGLDFILQAEWLHIIDD